LQKHCKKKEVNEVCLKSFVSSPSLWSLTLHFAFLLT